MKKGFTLSEALITLGIVGCIAALTIPSIMKNYKKKVYVSQLEKAYSQITDAAQAVINDEFADSFYMSTAGVPSSCNSDMTKSKGACYFLNSYFKTVKTDCQSADATDGGCLGTDYKSLDGSGVVNSTGINAEYCIQTTNNATICIYFDKDKGKTSALVDVNGPAEPNMAGLDTFSMDISSNGLVTDYDNGSVEAKDCGKKNSGSIYEMAAGCLNAVMEAGWKMKY